MCISNFICDLNVLGCYFDLGICMALELGENTGINSGQRNNEKKRKGDQLGLPLPSL